MRTRVAVAVVLLLHLGALLRVPVLGLDLRQRPAAELVGPHLRALPAELISHRRHDSTTAQAERGLRRGRGCCAGQQGYEQDADSGEALQHLTSRNEAGGATDRRKFSKRRVFPPVGGPATPSPANSSGFWQDTSGSRVAR